MFPIRCYTCNAVLAHVHPSYEALTQQGCHARDAMTQLGVDRMCCRRMFLGYVDLTTDMVRFGNDSMCLDNGGTVLDRRVACSDVVSCD